MSDLLRNLLVALMVVLMAVLAFFSGYLAKEYVDQRQARIAVSEDEFAVFWEAWDKIEQNYLGEMPNTQTLTYGAIRGSLSTLQDPYTIFLEPVVREEEKQNLRGNFGGIGATLSRDDNGQIRLQPTPGNPAERAGIRPGDILLAIDGEAVAADVPVGQIAERIRGEKGTPVVLTVVHEADFGEDGSAESVDVEIVRDDILIPSVLARTLRETPDIGYIQLIRFTGESGREINDAIVRLQNEGAERFVLDLRNNGGGLLDAAVEVSNNFLSNQTVYYQTTRGEGETEAKTAAETTLPDAPLVVLVNGGTASSSEIVAGALRDNGRAILVGEKTFGKGSVQLIYDLSDGSSVHVTWARWSTPSRQQLDQNGLEPNIEARPTQEGIDDGRDEQLERAVKYLQNGN